ncbi:hypothetical protein, partial [Pseudomonas sp. 2822-15]|uniref:hypothetical protein n=1 Tax=Pseudomonas sp. 2822-15 TaxID=1712677 RepID=UPI0013041BC4
EQDVPLPHGPISEDQVFLEANDQVFLLSGTHKHDLLGVSQYGDTNNNQTSLYYIEDDTLKSLSFESAGQSSSMILHTNQIKSLDEDTIQIAMYHNHHEEFGPSWFFIDYEIDFSSGIAKLVEESSFHSDEWDLGEFLYNRWNTEPEFY